MAEVMQRWTRGQQRRGQGLASARPLSPQPRTYDTPGRPEQGGAARRLSGWDAELGSPPSSALSRYAGAYPTIESLEQESQRLQAGIQLLQQEAQELAVRAPLPRLATI